MKRTLVLPAFFLLMSAAALAAQTPQPVPKSVNPVGDFEFTSSVNGETMTGVFSVTKKDDALTGKIISDMMPEIPINGVKVDQNKITLLAALPEGELTIVLTFEDENKFTGSWAVGGDGGPISGKRKAASGG